MAPRGGRRWSTFHSCNVSNIWFVFKNSVNSVVQRGFPELFYNKASVIVFDWKCSSTIIFQCDCSVRCCIASRGGFPEPGRHLPGNRLCQGQRESGGLQPGRLRAALARKARRESNVETMMRLECWLVLVPFEGSGDKMYRIRIRPIKTLEDRHQFQRTNPFFKNQWCFHSITQLSILMLSSHKAKFNWFQKTGWN